MAFCNSSWNLEAYLFEIKWKEIHNIKRKSEKT